MDQRQNVVSFFMYRKHAFGSGCNSSHSGLRPDNEARPACTGRSFPQSLRFWLLCSVNLLDSSDNLQFPSSLLLFVLFASLLLLSSIIFADIPSIAIRPSCFYQASPLMLKSKRFLVCLCCCCGAAADDVLVPDA